MEKKPIKSITKKPFPGFLAIYFPKLIFLSSIIIASCAQISAPTGGNKDTTPPAVLKYQPENNSINFAKKEIKLEFNEWIQNIQNPNNQIIISPPIQPFPRIEIARNVLSIKFKDTLQPSTTYTVFFGDNIKDNNEGNPISDLKYIFSTGSVIDSLSTAASIETALDKFPDNTYMLLYKQLDDSAFVRSKPFYMSKVAADGKAQIDNIKEGDYRVYALSDKNGNYFYDLPTEAIAYADSIIHITEKKATINMELFLPEPDQLRVVDFDRTIKGGIVHFLFNKELSFIKDEITVAVLDQPEIQPIAFQDQRPLSATEKSSRLSVYFPKLKSDTGSFKLIVKANGSVLDTFAIALESKNFKKPVSFFTDTTAQKNLSVYPSKALKLSAVYYSIQTIDTTKIYITDTALHKISMEVSREADLCTYLFSANWIPDMRYRLHIEDSAMLDIAGNANQKQEFAFTAKSPKKLGNLSVTFEFPKPQTGYVLTLRDNAGKIVDQQTTKDTTQIKINYGLLPPGTYSAQVIEDKNYNGIWNSGSFFNKTLPEKIYKEPKPIIVKENWESEEIIKVDFSVRARTATPAAPSEKINTNIKESIKTETTPAKKSILKK